VEVAIHVLAANASIKGGRCERRSDACSEKFVKVLESNLRTDLMLPGLLARVDDRVVIVGNHEVGFIHFTFSLTVMVVVLVAA
jgi:hypothetical protein